MQELDNSALEKKSALSAEDTADRVKGAIYGAICGNSLGGSSIGLNYKEIAGTVGLSGLKDFAPGLSKSLLPEHQAGQWLADGFLGMTLADSLIESQGKLDEANLRQHFAKLLTDEEFLRSKPGVPCLAGLRHMVDRAELAKEGPEAVHINAASRVFAIGCLPGGSKSDKPSQIAAKQAAMTHGDSRAKAAAAVVADSIHYFLQGGTLKTADEVRNYVNHELTVANEHDARFAEAWDDVAPDLDYANPADELPYSLINVESSVNELVPTAVGIFLIFRHDAEAAICAAARSGGDTDTVASLVGALSGAYHGFSKLPEKWLNQIDHKDRIDKMCEQIIKLWK